MMQPSSIVLNSSALSIRKFCSRGVLGSVVQFRGVLPEAVPCVVYAPDNVDGQVGILLWLTFLSRYTNSSVWLYTWPAVSRLNMVVTSGIAFVCKYMISLLASDTVRPNTAHTTSIMPTTFMSFSGNCETTTAPSAS